MNKQDFIDAINHFQSMTDAEQRISQYFMANYSVLPFAKIDELCKQIGVGKATLGRFLQRLGFVGFIDFKKQVTAELTHTLTTPIERYETDNGDLGSSENNLLAQHHIEVLSNLDKTFHNITDEQFESALELMRQPKGKLYVMGSASSEALATYFYLLARYLRREVILIEADISKLPHQLVDVGKDDILFAISYHRYSSVTVRLVKWFHQHGGSIIIMTDQAVNPFAAYSDIQFVVESAGNGFFNNRTAGFAVIEGLIKGLSIHKEKENRFQRIEGLFEEFSFFKT
ncbi:MurR/RpiR family transcriptional regulator [Photobacterium damselae]|uniref:MurR/RpiR family transcriptional regulator n=1 Tax=Photobacterium damselae TaxID=38293 RepID=UPI001EDC9B3B|nr:MurR/RpiR family transcriptional regulator [Photobacterium damselae]MCG3814726.1 MurR/RpiR family transcriptional regulator [Photobacterium damselae]